MRDAARRPRCTAVELPTISERSQEVGITRRGTVSSAVSPVGPDLVGSSVAERERVSPQRARFEGGACVAHRLAIVFRSSHSVTVIQLTCRPRGPDYSCNGFLTGTTHGKGTSG